MTRSFGGARSGLVERLPVGHGRDGAAVDRWVVVDEAEGDLQLGVRALQRLTKPGPGPVVDFVEQRIHPAGG